MCSKAEKELKPGMKLCGIDARDVKIDDIRILELETAEITYNFEVAQFHTYYVGKTPVIVHNACAGADFKADLSTAKGLSRSSHRAAGNKQLHSSMESNPELRSFLKNKYGADVFERAGKGLMRFPE